MENKNDDIWVKSMKRYHKYIDEKYGIEYNEKASAEANKYQLENAKKIMNIWFKVYSEWFGVNRKINSIEEFNMIADLMGY